MCHAAKLISTAKLVDFAETEGYQELIIIDVCSKWIEAIPLHQATTATTIATTTADLLC